MKLDRTHAWAVAITLPKDEGKGRRWAHNDSVTVITAGGAVAAISEVMREYPDAVVWNVNHLGSRTVFMLDLPGVPNADAVKHALEVLPPWGTIAAHERESARFDVSAKGMRIIRSALEPVPPISTESQGK